LWLRLEGEYREHPANLLRAGGDSAVFLNLEATWRPHPRHRWELLLRLDNLTDKAFESLPGTPGARREGRLTARYRW